MPPTTPAPYSVARKGVQAGRAEVSISGVMRVGLGANSTRRSLPKIHRAQHLERSQSPELLEMGAQEGLDHLEDLARAPDLDVVAGFSDRARHQQGQAGER